MLSNCGKLMTLDLGVIFAENRTTNILSPRKHGKLGTFALHIIRKRIFEQEGNIRHYSTCFIVFYCMWNMYIPVNHNLFYSSLL